MRFSFVRVVGGCIGLALGLSPSPSNAQRVRQLELALLGGTAHTDRAARLSAEEWVEPFSGVRLDARLAKLWGGRVGVTLQADRYSTRVDGFGSPPCVAEFCTASDLRLRSSLLPLSIRSFDERVMAGATWQRPLTSWLSADVAGLFGVRRLESQTRIEGAPFGQSFPMVNKGVVGVQAGMSAQWRGLIGGAAFEYGGGSQWNGVRRGQNRVALRVGYAIPLGASE